jgi:protocatechuate 3,4-dioxygenase beta subunit
MKNLIFIFSIICLLGTCNLLQAQDAAMVLEEIPFDYYTRSPIYDYNADQLSSTDTIPGFETYETKLMLTGTVFKSDGVTPAKDVILYICQADEDGEYILKYENDKRYVYNRGWVITDAEGKYTFYTYIPGSYRHTRELRNINPIIKEAGKPEYAMNSLIFEDDPFLTKACRKKLDKKGLNNILTTLKKENMYLSTYNITLKEDGSVAQ